MSKLLFISDIHLTDGTPRARLDDYQQTQLRKMNWVFDYAINNNIKTLYDCGDLFEKAQAPLHKVTQWTQLFRDFNFMGIKVPYRAVSGNHSQYHRLLQSGNTTFEVLVAAGLIENKDCYYEDNDVKVTMVDFGQDIPQPEEGKYNILCLHAGVSEEAFPWPTNEPWYVAKDLMKEYKYDFFVTGHNHKSFMVSTRMGKQRLYNVGSLFRSNVDQAEHSPRVLVFDTESKEVEEVFVPIEDATRVLDFEKHYELVEMRNRNHSFVDGLSNNVNIALDFEAQLNYYMKEQKASDGTKQIIREVVH